MNRALTSIGLTQETELAVLTKLLLDKTWEVLFCRVIYIIITIIPISFTTVTIMTIIRRRYFIIINIIRLKITYSA